MDSGSKSVLSSNPQAFSISLRMISLTDAIAELPCNDIVTKKQGGGGMFFQPNPISIILNNLAMRQNETT
jgi:hypothetical protein